MVKNQLQKTAYTLNYLLKNKSKNWILYRKQLENQYLPRKKLEEIQLTSFVKMVRHAYENVPFYHALYHKARVNPNDITRIEHIQRLPVVTKEDMKKAGRDKLCAQNLPASRGHESTTSGSYGDPFLVISDRESLDVEHAAWLRELSAMGYRVGDRILRIRAHDHKKKNPFSELTQRDLCITPWDLSADLEGTIRKIKQFQPDFIETYNSLICDLSKALLHKKSLMRVKGIQVIGSSLDATDKKRISIAFGNPLICHDYGAAEAMRVAYQCEKEGGYHVDITRFIIELIHDRKYVKEKEEGEIIVTNLENFMMPFIRYRIRDSAVHTDRMCQCGRTFPIIEEIKGRVVEAVVAPSGKLVRVGAILGVVFSDEYEFVDRVQGEVMGKGRILIRVQVTPKINQAKLAKYRKKLRMMFPDFEFELKVVKHIPLAESGKAVLLKNASPYNLAGF